MFKLTKFNKNSNSLVEIQQVFSLSKKLDQQKTKLLNLKLIWQPIHCTSKSPLWPKARWKIW